MKQKTLWIEREAALYWLTWEFGIRDGYRRFRACARSGNMINVTEPAAILLPLSRPARAADYRAALRRILDAANHTNGRLGNPMRGFITAAA